ncbi:MAG TPA: hypothetical protein VMU41_17270 [Candidatus Binataceae bacterium]|nr:hypothetical protein [Candidatus Binataceae bacterium]
MDIRKATAALLSVGLLIGISAPAWSADSKGAVTGVTATVSNPEGNSLPSILKSVFKDTAAASSKPGKQCKASHIYSQHDVVGDPETCTMNRVTFGGGGSATGIP